jgi:deoxyribose-phosphate aldolase
MEAFRILLSCIDLTSLEGSDNSGTISNLCREALSFGESGLPLPAAVCVYPPFIRLAKKRLEGSGIRVAAVAGAFPSGQSPLHLRVSETLFAIDEGADEIDMVISRGRLLVGDDRFVFDEVAAIRNAAKQLQLKVILETGELRSPELIRKASRIAIDAGADFLKTSTGKILPGATEEAAEIMLTVIKEHFDKTGRRIGIKPAGGISEPARALRYYALTQRILGNEWLTKDLFRIGASHLAGALARELNPGYPPPSL